MTQARSLSTEKSLKGELNNGCWQQWYDDHETIGNH